MGEPGARGESPSHPPRYPNSRVLIVGEEAAIHDDFVDMLTHDAGERGSDDIAMAFALGQVEATRVERAVFPDFELSHATDGADACRQVEAAARSGRPFALAFVDVRMPPGMDGIETIRRMRKADGDIEIVIMTAYRDRLLGEMVRDAGSLHKTLYLKKPFFREEILRMAVSLVGKWNVERALASRSREIAASHRTLEAVLDASEDAMVMYDASERVAFANRRFELLCGLARADLHRLPPKALAGKLGERFRKPRALDAQPGLEKGNASGLVEQITPSDGGPGLFYRFTAAVTGEEGEIGRLEVYRSVSRDIEVQRMKAELQRLRGELERTHSFGGMIGGSRRMREVYGRIQEAASSDLTVLVCGETGTGKEMVARAFHANSARKSGPFLAIDCAAIPEGLVESELFGHRRGSFTGAEENRSGAFERARGGTLFLDEVADVRLDMQVKLLRVLQDLKFRRVGGTRSRTADVRIIASTGRNLERAVRKGAFRQDLFYRLSVLPVTIPPLRERREDIPLLADHFLRKQARRAGKSIAGLSTAAMQRLFEYDWPGNVRELENVMQRAVLLEATDVLRAESLPRRLSPAPGIAAAATRAGKREIRTLAATEREALGRALAITQNNVSAAARGLGINRATLYRKIKKHGLRSAK